MADDLWHGCFDSFTRSAFRFEVQGIYREPKESGPLRQFLAGKRPDLSYLDAWLAEVAAGVTVGRSYRRVRGLTDPLTDYLRFELSFTQLNVDAGEDVRLLPAVQAGRLPAEDFWLFDDEKVLAMRFGDRGLTGVDLVTDAVRVARYREIRDIAWQNAVPFRECAAT